MQLKETSELYVRCSTVCFDRCVFNFTARKLNNTEVMYLSLYIHCFRHLA